ncbi:MAG: redoxin domain-containing protein [Saprospiraceae bacterium]|nr:redoxin domain-containing protein [Saprospiraceae bacterium]
MNKLFNIVLVILLCNIVFAQDMQLSLDKVIDLEGRVFNANEAIEMFKKEDSGPIIRYFQMQGIKDNGGGMSMPILEEKKAPKNFLNQSIIKTRFAKNKLFGDSDMSKTLISKYIGEDQHGQSLLMFMFKECVHCKTDLPHLKRLMESDFSSYSVKVVTFSKQDDIEAILKEHNIDCDVFAIPKSEIIEEFDIHAYPRYLVFNQFGDLTTEISSLKNHGTSATVKNN